MTMAVYLPVFGFDFVNWDDPWYVTKSPLVTSWNVSNLVRIVSQPAVKNYAPLTTLSYLVDHTLWGLRPGGYHGTNLLLHMLNAVLVYVLLWRMTRSQFISSLTAVLFAVHPVQIESVAWVSSRKGVLSGTFILLSLIYWLRPKRTAKDEGLGTLFLLLALLAKAIAVVVPAVVLSYDLWIRRKKFSEAAARQFLPGTMACILLLVTIASQTTAYGGLRDHLELSKLHILAVDSMILWKYAGMLLWPNQLTVLYDPPTEGIAVAATLATLGWAVVVWGAYRLRRTWPYVGWGLLTAFVFLVPVLNLVPITTLMNDRYLYLPCIPLFALAAAGARRLPQWFETGLVGERTSRLCHCLTSAAIGGVCRPRIIGRRQAVLRSSDRENALLDEQRDADDGFQNRSRRSSSSGTAVAQNRVCPPSRRVAKTAGEWLCSLLVVIAVTGCTLRTHFHLPVWRNSRALWQHAAQYVGHLPVVQYQLADAEYAAGEPAKAIIRLHRVLRNDDLDGHDRRRFEKTLTKWRRSTQDSR